MDIVDHITARLLPRSVRLWTELSAARQKAMRRAREDGLNNKIFGIGLSRTGTTSLACALRQLGYTTAHWEWGNRVLQLEDFFQFDAVTDTPCAARFETLFHTFPRAKFVYTTRDIGSWTRSVKRFFGVSSPKDAVALSDLPSKGVVDANNRLNTLFVRTNLYGGYDSWEDSYRAHDERVRSFFSDKPERQLLEIDIPGGDGWEKLCGFLGHEIPQIDFPHANQGRG